MVNQPNLRLQLLFLRRGYIYGAIKGHRYAMFAADVQSLDGTKPDTNHETKLNPNTNQTVILILTQTLTLFSNPIR